MTFHVAVEALGGDRTQLTATVTWRSPRSAGITIRVYDVTECLARPEPMPRNAEGPCLVPKMTLPEAALELVASAPASAGAVSWTWVDESELGWPGAAREMVVLAASGSSGQSTYAIASPGYWTSKMTF